MPCTNHEFPHALCRLTTRYDRLFGIHAARRVPSLPQPPFSPVIRVVSERRGTDAALTAHPPSLPTDSGSNIAGCGYLMNTAGYRSRPGEGVDVKVVLFGGNAKARVLLRAQRYDIGDWRSIIKLHLESLGSPVA